MNLRLPLFVLCQITVACGISAQVNFTANDTIPLNLGQFRYGVNPGVYYPWRDEMLANIAAGNPDLGIEGVGVDAFRPSLPETFVDFWGYDIRLDAFKHYDSLGMKDNVVFVGFPAEAHRDQEHYCASGPSELFANMYLPIWDNGENGTPVNDSNYYAVYLWKLVNVYTPYVKFWEIWNEPDFDFVGNSSKQPGEEGNWWEYNPEPCHYALHAPVFHYNRLLRISYEVIKSISPDDYVTVGGIGYPSFLDVLLRNTDNPADGSVTPEYQRKGGAYFDVLSYHSYPHIDNSLRVWDDAIFGFKYFRHSDRCVEGMLARKDQFSSVLEKYGYDGVNFPEKHWIITESNIPRKTFDEYIGSDEAQVNYIIKALVACQQNDIWQFHIYHLGDWERYSDATTEFQLMGLYSALDSITPYNQRVNSVGIAYKTTSDLLKGKRFDPEQTAKLELPETVDGGAFKGASGDYIYVLWAVTNQDRSEKANVTYAFPNALNIKTLNSRAWNFSNEGISFLQEAKAVQLTGSPVFLTDSRSEPAAETNRIILESDPNPFSGKLHILLQLPESMLSSLSLFDVNGRVVNRFFSNQKLAEGEHHLQLEGRNLPSGVYILRFEASGGRRVVSKVVKS